MTKVGDIVCYIASVPGRRGHSCLAVCQATAVRRNKDGVLIWRKTAESPAATTVGAAVRKSLWPSMPVVDVGGSLHNRPCSEYDRTRSPSPATPPAGPTTADLAALGDLTESDGVPSTLADLPPAERREYATWADELPPSELPVYDPEDTL